MTVPVSVQQRIRVLDAHGMSWRSIAKEVGVARDTVAKYAGREDCSPGVCVQLVVAGLVTMIFRV